MYGDVGRSLTAFFIICIIASAGLGAALVWLIPLLWSLVKPWLHMVTA